ncbi:hypothetical protein [Sphingomonas sp. CROZ-RG-20F-R02-07]|uniref:hypothetical protein n=1 Tax=Sphingomonas sp. CROZ-RG-20F-R02-07 TaxID=2914832 RepID=UPI001F55AE32|nr:hypothetical protein [Sphingomonas sp. CROZ-RG-20F-R02-07]
MLAIMVAACGSSRPAPPVVSRDLIIETGYARATRDLWSHYWDAGDDNPAGSPRIRATQGNGGPDNGLIVDSQRATTFWQMAQFHKLLFGQWVFDQSATAREAIGANWRAIRTTYSDAQLRGDGRADQSISVSDDAGWKAAFLAQVHTVTGDPAALHDLEEMIPAVTARFLDPNQPRLFHGKTPAGRALFSNPHGILYAAQEDRHAYATYGRVSTLYEATLALAALYAYEQDKDPAYLSYAKETYRWIHTDLRNVKQSSDDTATGVYLCELMLEPAGLQSDHPQAKNRYYGKPVRALSAEYGGGTLAMAVLAARLYRLTHDSAYLVEARDIIKAFVLPDAFGRWRKGRLLFVNARDPWTEGYWYPEAVAEVLTLPGIDPAGTFRSAVRNTAAAIMAARMPDGYYGADWSGTELDPADGVMTWFEESTRANGGRGGGLAAPRQIMTSANSALLLQAAHLLRS